MKPFATVISTILVLAVIGGSLILYSLHPGRFAADDTNGIWDHDNLFAWHTVLYDAKKRGAEERAAMLERLGIKQFAYDGSTENISTLDDELAALEKHHIKLVGWWFPTGANDPLSVSTLELFKKHGIHPQLWVSGGGTFTHSPEEQAARVQQETDRIEAVEKLAAPYGCPVELYNHDGWFGNEDNQLAVLDELQKRGITDVGLVYNFSHAIDNDHDDSIGFQALWKKIQPHVVVINVAGIGPRLGIDYSTRRTVEMSFMRTIQDSGWRGPVGLVAQRGGDAEITLGNDRMGLDWIAAELKQPGSGGPKPHFVAVAATPASPASTATTATTDAVAEEKAARANLNLPATAYSAPRVNLPKYETIPAATKAELTPANGWPGPASFKDWTRSNGGPTGMRYSALDEINKQNVSHLREAWTYHSHDGAATIQCNPIIVDGVIFLPTAGNALAAVDAINGTEIWRYKPEHQGFGLEDVPARRGLIYWPGDADNPPRVLFTMGTWLYALDPKTGTPLANFGEQGRTRLQYAGCSVAPVIYKNVIVMPGFKTGVFGYDVRTGAHLWTFNTLPANGEPGSDTWIGTERISCNVWGGIAVDESRGIVYVGMGQPHPNFIGYRHVGDNLFGNSEIALDAMTGKYLWHFQEVRHDVWDLDIPAAPLLVTVQHDGMKVDAVAQVTKLGNTLLLDRVTGRPLFPFRLRRAPDFKLPGDLGSPYQPDVELPQPFARQEFTLADVTNRTPQAHDAVMKIVSQANLGWFVPFELGKPSIYFGIHGGAEWTGAAADPQGHLYVTSSELPWVEGVDRVGASAQTPMTADAVAGRQIFQVNCASCHGTNLEGHDPAPSLLNLAKRMDEAGIRALFKKGQNGMPPQPQLSEDQIKKLVALLLNKSTEATDGAAVASHEPAQYADMGYTRLLDPDQYPGCTPPWGTLTRIDLNTGKIAWQVPLGEYPELTAQGVPKTGTENFGGATVTAGGIVFAGGTRDNQLRAFDTATGEELWKRDLPLRSTAPPAIYEAGGHEYVILPVTGGGRMGGPVGDSWISFALPQ